MLSFSTDVEIGIHIILEEDGKKHSLVLRRNANDKMKLVAEEIGEIFNISKYRLTFFYKGHKLTLND